MGCVLSERSANTRRPSRPLPQGEREAARDLTGWCMGSCSGHGGSAPVHGDGGGPGCALLSAGGTRSFERARGHGTPRAPTFLTNTGPKASPDWCPVRPQPVRVAPARRRFVSGPAPLSGLSSPQGSGRVLDAGVPCDLVRILAPSGSVRREASPYGDPQPQLRPRAERSGVWGGGSLARTPSCAGTGLPSLRGAFPSAAGADPHPASARRLASAPLGGWGHQTHSPA